MRSPDRLIEVLRSVNPTLTSPYLLELLHAAADQLSADRAAIKALRGTLSELQAQHLPKCR